MQLKIPFSKDKYLSKDFFIVLGIIVIALGSFLFGVYFSASRFSALPPENNLNPENVFIRGVFNTEKPKESGDVDFSMFWDVWAAVQENYLNRKDLDYQKMVYGAIKGMVDSLEDPYTNFFEPEIKKEFDEEVSGKFEGIGIEIGMRDEMLTVVAPMSGTPAQKAGLKAGDKIIKIDDEFTDGLGLDEAVSLIRGPKGSKVTLTILRKTESKNEQKEVEIVRDTINIPSVTWEKIGDDIAQIRVFNFYDPTSFEFRKAIFEMMLSGRKKIILDLRDNPGGYFDLAIELAGWFLEPGSVVVKQDDGTGPVVCESCKSSGLGLLRNYKMVILTNGGSASASEILAGALRDNRGIKLIGQQTFGKGVVQEVFPLGNDSSIKITTMKWLTPNGSNINDVGLTPDFQVEDSDDLDKDPQLDKAVEILRSL